jgi:ribosomal protein S12 methylthiotransferase
MPQDSEIHSVAFVSLGCPKNLVDSERMLGLLAGDGLRLTADAEQADAIVINTCGFLEASKVESLREIRRAVALKERGRCRRVVVAGCLVQRHKTRLLAEAPGIDRLVGVFDREHIVQAVRGPANPHQDHGHFLGKYHDLSTRLAAEANLSVTPQNKTNRLAVFEDDRARLRLTPRHYAYLRISEGCNQGCAFCTIPSIRGPMRSKPIQQILAEARELAADGAVELNLIGQDTTSYGTDIGYTPGLAGLLRTLDKQLRDVHWLRLMYAYPSCFSDEMIGALADCDRVIKYIDMPLQHINDRLLTLMRRRVSRRQIETLLAKLRGRINGLTLRTTFITGSPGETDAEHRELLRFVRDFGFDMMGVFPFSAEPGTPMGRMDGQTPDELKRQRLEELMLAQQEVAFAKARQKIGQTVDVLIDRRRAADAKNWIARSTAQAPDIDSVTYVKGDDLYAGQLLTVRIDGADGYDSLACVPQNLSQSLPILVPAVQARSI